MEQDDLLSKDLLFSCYAHDRCESEQFVQEHAFGYVQSGILMFQFADKTISCGEGDFFFIRRNQLSKITKYTAPGGEFKSFSVFLRQPFFAGF